MSLNREEQLTRAKHLALGYSSPRELRGKVHRTVGVGMHGYDWMVETACGLTSLWMDTRAPGGAAECEVCWRDGVD